MGNIIKADIIGSNSIKNIKPKELRSYLCSLDGQHWTTYNALSAGMAKNQYRIDLDMEIPYTSIKCRVGGYPYTSDDFIKNAKYRDVEFAYCGMAVQVGEMGGVIVGNNSSANLDVLITDGKYKGQVLNCHPHWEITYYDKKGNIIKRYAKNE